MTEVKLSKKKFKRLLGSKIQGGTLDESVEEHLCSLLCDAATTRNQDTEQDLLDALHSFAGISMSTEELEALLEQVLVIASEPEEPDTKLNINAPSFVFNPNASSFKVPPAAAAPASSFDMSAMGQALSEHAPEYQPAGYDMEGYGYEYEEGDPAEAEIGPGWVESYAMPEEYQAANQDGSWQAAWGFDDNAALEEMQVVERMNALHILTCEYPGFDQDSLEAMLDANGGDLMSTIDIIEQMQEPVPEEEPPEFTSANFPSLPDGDRRAAAAAAAMPASATQAYQAGNPALAKELSAKGKWHAEQMKESHAHASSAIYAQRNSMLPQGGRGAPLMIDLHGLHVEEAINILRQRVAEWRSSAGGQQLVHLVVGTGHHTRGTRTPARLPAAVEEFLRAQSVPYSEPQPGLLEVCV